MSELNNGAWGRFFSSTAEQMIRFRWLVIPTAVLLTVFFLFQMKGLKFDNSNDVWFMESDRSVKLLDKFHDTFGNDEFVYLLLDTDDFFQPEIIRLIGRLAEALEAEVPHVRDMAWLGNVEYIEGTETGLKIYGLLETVSETTDKMAEVREKALNETAYINNLISPDGKATAIILEMENYPESRVEAEKEIAPAVRKILCRPEYESLKPYLIGGPILNHDYNEIAAKESWKFLGVGLFVQMLILIFVARSVRGLFVPLIIVFLSVIWTMGMIGLMGFKLNIMVSMIPTLLICVGIGDSLHFIADYQDQCWLGLKPREAMLKTFAIVGLPCLLTTLTTSAGFLSFLTVRIRAFRELGVYAAIGVTAALVLTIVIVPTFYSFGIKKQILKKNHTGGKKRRDLFDRLLEGIYRITIARPLCIIMIFLLLTVISVVGILNIQVESNTARMLLKKVPIRQAYDFVDERMGGSMSLEIMLDTGKKDGVKDIEFLKGMDRLQRFVDAHPLTTKTSSVLDVMKKMRRGLHSNNQEFYSIPETGAAASQYLFMYETSGGTELDKMVSFNYDIARITVKTPTLDTGDVRRFMQEIEAFSRNTFDPSVSVEMTGALTWIKALNDKLKEGLRNSIITALIVISLLMTLVLRSVKLGLISMIPNVFPVLITLGLAGFSGIYIDLAIMSSSAIILGVVVDDSIHFFTRYRKEFERLRDYKHALRITLRTVGRPITFTTIVLCLGFSVMILSSVTGLIKFGCMLPFAFIWALLADFFLAPALILILKPLGE